MSAPAVLFSRRRGACPGLSAPMQTGDGLLVRLLPTGAVSLPALAALCAAARRHGNGIVEITARGSIQVRGLSAASAPRFAQAVAVLGIAAADGVPVLTNPLAGRDPDEILDVGPIAAELRSALAEATFVKALAPKISIALDGGGELTLDAVAADIRFRADRFEGNAVFRVAVGGDGASAAPLGFITPLSAIEAVLRLLTVIAERGRSARARDVVAAEGDAPFRSAIERLLVANFSPATRQPGEPIGVHRLRGGALACGIGLAFGHTDATALKSLTETAAARGSDGVRPAPGRAPIVIGLGLDAISPLRGAAAKLGFIVDADDPRRHVFACPGAPICSSAHLAARAIAPHAAEIAASHLGAGFQIHISGCAKGCAHPGAAALTVVGAADGCRLVASGSAGDEPFATVAATELTAAIVRYANARRREAANV